MKTLENLNIGERRPRRSKWTHFLNSNLQVQQENLTNPQFLHPKPEPSHFKGSLNAWILPDTVSTCQGGDVLSSAASDSYHFMFNLLWTNNLFSGLHSIIGLWLLHFIHTDDYLHRLLVFPWTSVLLRCLLKIRTSQSLNEFCTVARTSLRLVQLNRWMAGLKYH